MNWFNVTINDGTKEGYTYVGSSSETLESIVEKVSRGEMIKLDNLLYRDEDGEIYSWKKWDDSLIPTVYINSKFVCSILQFKDHPRKFLRQPEE